MHLCSAALWHMPDHLAKHMSTFMEERVQIGGQGQPESSPPQLFIQYNYSVELVL